jgi:hypothetical protein
VSSNYLRPSEDQDIHTLVIDFAHQPLLKRHDIQNNRVKHACNADGSTPQGDCTNK